MALLRRKAISHKNVELDKVTDRVIGLQRNARRMRFQISFVFPSRSRRCRLVDSYSGIACATPFF